MPASSSVSPPLADRAQRLVSRGLELIPERLELLLSGRPQVRLDGESLDPGIQMLLTMMRLRGSDSFIRRGASDPVAERRRVVADARLAQGARTPVGCVAELEVEGGRRALRARHYAPPGGLYARVGGPAALPLIVFLHGGGWVVGGLETHDELCRLICRHAECHVLAVDYSLAPEHPFPAAAEDALAALRWALEHAADLGADPRRVGVAGDSAGGNLAAVACQVLAHESEGPQPALQVLIYPSTDFAGSYASSELFAEGFYLDARSRRWCNERYLPPGADLGDPRLSPLHGRLDGLPAAIVITAAFDPLRDEGEAYAQAMREAGVDVVHRRVPGMIHGFMSMTGLSRPARDGVLRLAGTIRARLVAPLDRDGGS